MFSNEELNWIQVDPKNAYDLVETKTTKKSKKKKNEQKKDVKLFPLREIDSEWLFVGLHVEV